MSRCIACDNIIEKARNFAKTNDDLCVRCANIVEITINDPLPEVGLLEYSHPFAKEGMEPNKRSEY